MKKIHPTVAIIASMLVLSSVSVSVLADPPGLTKCSPYPMCAIYGIDIVTERARENAQAQEKAKSKSITKLNNIGNSKKDKTDR